MAKRNRRGSQEEHGKSRRDGFIEDVALAEKVPWAAKLKVVEPGAVVFSSTDAVAETQLATMRSGRPSPFTSDATTT